MILGVAGSSPVSHPFFGSVAPCVADIRRGESNDEYHGDEEYWNCSRAKTLLDSPLIYHGRYVAKTATQQSSDALEHGTLLHAWLERGDAFLDALAVPPQEMLTPTGLVGKEARKWAENEHGPGAVVVAPKLAFQLRSERDAIMRHPAARAAVESIAERELSVRWTAADGTKLRCKFDALLADGAVIDLKTTREQDILAEFWRSVVTYRYGMSEAWYRAGMAACGMEPKPLRYIVVSTSGSLDVQVVTLPDALVADGLRQMERAIADLRIRTSLDWWLPESHGEVVELPIPAHVLGRLES